MKDLDPVFESIAVLNPVPREDELPSAASSPTALLARIDGRDQMTITKTRTTKPAPTPPTRRRGPLVAAAAFIAVLVIGGGIALFSGPEATPPETTLAPSTTEGTTTTSTPTTTEPTPPPTAPVPATVDPGLGEAFMDAFLSYEPAQLEALPWDDAVDESVLGTQDFWQSLNYVVLEGPTCTPFTRTVECSVVAQDDFSRVLVGVPVVDTYSIQLSSDGTTIRFVQIDAADTEVTFAFLAWVPENSPELFDEGSVCAGGIGEPACMAAHVELLDDFVATDEYQEQFGAGS